MKPVSDWKESMYTISNVDYKCIHIKETMNNYSRLISKTFNTYMSWGSVESSVLEYKKSEPPLSILRNFRDAKSVYSFVTANISTQTPAWTATAACEICVNVYVLQKHPTKEKNK